MLSQILKLKFSTCTGSQARGGHTRQQQVPLVWSQTGCKQDLELSRSYCIFFGFGTPPLHCSLTRVAPVRQQCHRKGPLLTTKAGPGEGHQNNWNDQRQHQFSFSVMLLQWCWPQSKYSKLFLQRKLNFFFLKLIKTEVWFWVFWQQELAVNMNKFFSWKVLPTFSNILPSLGPFCPEFSSFCPLSSSGQEKGCFGVFWGCFITYISRKGVCDGWVKNRGWVLVFWAKWDPTWAKWDPLGQFVWKVAKCAL